MPHLAYSTSVHPYPAEMWDSAAEHLSMMRAWMEVLLVCPDPVETCATAIQEMANRDIEDVYSLVYHETLSDCYCIRISRLQYIDPRWDAVEEVLKNPNNRVALLGINLNKITADAAIIEARAAMAERGLSVSVGYASDRDSLEGLLRIELA